MTQTTATGSAPVPPQQPAAVPPTPAGPLARAATAFYAVAPSPWTALGLFAAGVGTGTLIGGGISSLAPHFNGMATWSGAVVAGVLTTVGFKVRAAQLANENMGRLHLNLNGVEGVTLALAAGYVTYNLSNLFTGHAMVAPYMPDFVKQLAEGGRALAATPIAERVMQISLGFVGGLKGMHLGWKAGTLPKNKYAGYAARPLGAIFGAAALAAVGVGVGTGISAGADYMGPINYEGHIRQQQTRDPWTIPADKGCQGGSAFLCNHRGDRLNLN